MKFTQKTFICSKLTNGALKWREICSKLTINNKVNVIDVVLVSLLLNDDTFNTFLSSVLLVEFEQVNVYRAQSRNVNSQIKSVKYNLNDHDNLLNDTCLGLTL